MVKTNNLKIPYKGKENIVLFCRHVPVCQSAKFIFLQILTRFIMCYANSDRGLKGWENTEKTRRGGKDDGDGITFI